jgi:hypothetical protein
LPTGYRWPEDAVMQPKEVGGPGSATASVRGKEGGAVQLLNMYPVPRLVSTMVGGTSLSFLRRRRI